MEEIDVTRDTLERWATKIREIVDRLEQEDPSDVDGSSMMWTCYHLRTEKAKTLKPSNPTITPTKSFLS